MALDSNAGRSIVMCANLPLSIAKCYSDDFMLKGIGSVLYLPFYLCHPMLEIASTICTFESTESLKYAKLVASR